MATKDGTDFMHVHALLNVDSGTLRSEDPQDLADRIDTAFRDRGHSIETVTVRGAQFEGRLEKSAASQTDVILIAGGDGSVSAVADACYRTGKAIAVLPAGTMNLFARSLGVPLDLDEAVSSLAGGRIGSCDVALANGRPFVHQYSVGLHPNMAEERQQYSYDSRLAKIFASARALLSLVSRPPGFNVSMTSEEKRQSRWLSALAVSNNPYGPGHLPYADRLDGGTLGVYSAGVLTKAAYLKLAADLMAGTWSSNADLREERAERVVLEFAALRRRTSSALIDGELIPLERHVEIRSVPGGLKVLLPAIGH